MMTYSHTAALQPSIGREVMSETMSPKLRFTYLGHPSRNDIGDDVSGLENGEYQLTDFADARLQKTV